MNIHNKRKTATADSELSCKPCKKLSHTQPEAVQISNNYNHRVPMPMQLGLMNAYYCPKSKVWHTGHKGQRDAIRTLKRNMWGKSCTDGVEQWEI